MMQVPREQLYLYHHYQYYLQVLLSRRRLLRRRLHLMHKARHWPDTLRRQNYHIQ